MAPGAGLATPPAASTQDAVLAAVAVALGDGFAPLEPAAVAAAIPTLPADLLEPVLGVHTALTELAAELLRRGADGSEAAVPVIAEIQARDFVHRGLPVELVLAVHRCWHAAFARALLARLHAQVADRELLAATTAYSSAWLFAFADAVVVPVAGVFAAEKERWTRSATARRREEVAAILEGQAVDRDRASARLRYPLEAQHLAFVAWQDDEEGAGVVLPAVAESVRAAVDGRVVLAVPSAGGIMHGWVTVGEDADPTTAGVALATALEGAGTRVAFGAPAGGLDGFRESHAQALRARDVALLGCHGRDAACLHFDDVRLISLLTHDPDEARRFVERELGPLRADTVAMRRLATTLLAFLEEGTSYVAAARRLGVHENTVNYRVRRAGQLLRRRVDDGALRLHLALVLHHALRDG